MDRVIASIAAAAKELMALRQKEVPRVLFNAGLVSVVTVAAASAANTENLPQRGPSIPISIASEVPAGAVRHGPLFERIKTSLPDLPVLLTAESKIVFLGKPDFVGQSQVMAAMNAIMTDCLGPYTIDEGNMPSKTGDEWVQTSWVCRTAPDAPVRNYFDFKYSPEVDLAFDFKDGKISVITAFEVLPLLRKGDRTLRMDAYDVLKKAGRTTN